MKGLLIVMADGNIDDHELVKKAIRDCNVNHVFTSVYNGMQLIDLLFKQGAYSGGSEIIPDLLIMDIKLDLMDGFEVLKRIKASERVKNVPVYILTKDRSEEDVQKAMTLGAEDYFKKPLEYSELHKIVHGICEVRFNVK